MAENKVTIINRYKGTTPDDPKHWSKQIKKSLVFKDKHGSLNLIMLGGACDASFPYIASIDHKKIKNASKTSKLCEGDVVVEVGGEGVGGCTLNDVIELISQLPSQVTIKTVAADLLPLSLSAYLNEKFPKNSPDHCLQQTIRRNIYKRALPCTTRRPREGEVDGVDYKFLTVDEFMLLEKEGRLLEKGKYEGNFYGTLKPQPPPGASSSSHNHVIPWAGLPEHLYSMVKKSKPSNASAHNSLHNSAHTCSHNSSHTSSHASSTPPLHATSRASSTPPSPPHSHTSTHPSHTTPHASSTPTPHNNNASHTPSTPHSNRPDFSPPSTPQITPHSSFNKHHSKSVTNSSHSSSVTLNLSHSSTYTKSSSSSPFSTSSLTTVVNANPPSTHLNFTSFTDVSSSTTQPADTRTTPNLFFTDDNSASDDLTSEDFEPINHNNINNHNKNINNHNNNINNHNNNVNNHNNKNNTNNKNSNNHYQKNNTDAQNSSEASPNHSQPPQGAPQAATEACNQPVQQLIQTTLVKSAKGLGFSIIGVEDDESEGVWLVVKRLNSAGPAGVDNKLKRGDVLVSVNGREVCGLTHHDVVTMFKAIEVGDRVSLEVVRGHHSTHNFDLLEASQGADSSLEVVTTLAVTEEDEEEEGGVEEVLVQVLKGAAGFGFTLADRVGGQKVKQVVDVDRCEGLREGDLLVQVNSVPLTPLTHLQVVELLKSLPVAVPASFTLQRRVASKTSVSNNSTLNLQNLSHPPPPPRTINMKLPLQPCYHNNNNNNLIQHHHQQQQQHGNNDILERTQTSLQTPDFIPDIAFKEPHVLDVISNTTNNNSMNYNNSSMTYNNSNNSMTYNNNNQQDTHTCFQQQHVHHNKPLFLPCSTQDLVQVTLHKSLHGFGFRIIGGREEGSQVSIGLIVPGGPADQSGLMKLGQEILFIDHKCVIGAWHRDVVDLVLMASKTGIVHLALSNSVHSGAYDLSSHCGHSSDDSVSEVVLSRSSEEGFGFYILSSCSSATPVIGEIIENSPASRCGGLRVGSEIVAINDRLLRGLSHVEIVEVIKAAGTVIKLLVLNRAGECGACDGALLQQSVSPMLLPSLHSPALVPQPHLQPLMQPHFQPHFHLHQQLQLQYYQQQLQQYQQLPSQANTQELEVQLVRGHKGYGFSIRGGCDMNNTPMLVSKVLEGGVALQDGTLQVGDELTIINGVSTFGMTHQEAINSIQSASEVLNLKVKRFLTAENEEDL